MMKKIVFTTLIYLAAIMALSSCSKKLDGPWENNIHFSTTKVNFSSAGGSKMIASQGNWWWINGISINGKYINRFNEPEEGLHIGYGKAEYGAFGIPSSEIEYDEGADIIITLIETEWFRIIKEDAQTLIIEMAANNSGSVRKVLLYIQCGNYHERISITQK